MFKASQIYEINIGLDVQEAQKSFIDKILKKEYFMRLE